ncbi:PREDICTED: uncharacterized protein LOC109158491 [Ipomoea nil]|uniref:uncharacterized protein LOC109158491 n=1 Tax=Ipomoea nil TaxID=35883 RepID=UPI000900A84D|nr:PREDICTED: uncharacterized protein LOC109158491 [Ipomoea nil]
MPSPKTHRRGGSEEKNRKGRLVEKAKSFHGHGVENTAELLGRPRTVPDLISGHRSSTASTQMRFPSKLTKLLLNVTIQRCLGAVQVLMSSESTVEDLIAAALRQYVKEGRRSALPSTDPADFGLHYSQFSLEGLDRADSVMTLGSRNFFLCMKTSPAGTEGGGATPSCGAAPGCSSEVDRVTKIGLPWIKFMDILL